MRQHRMRGVAEQGHAAEAPARQRVAIDHREFQHHFRGADQRRHVEPVEMPVGHGGQEVFQPASPVPVASLVLWRFDIADPVHQLAALAVDIVPDRINQELRRMMPADTDHAGTGQKRLPARNAPPHVDARIFWRPFVRVKLLAQHGVDAFRADDDAAALRG